MPGMKKARNTYFVYVSELEMNDEMSELEMGMSRKQVQRMIGEIQMTHVAASL